MFEVIESLAQRPWADAGQGALEFAEAFRPTVQVTQNERGPLRANDLHGCRDTAVFSLKLAWKRRDKFHTLQNIVLDSILNTTKSIA